MKKWIWLYEDEGTEKAVVHTSKEAMMEALNEEFINEDNDITSSDCLIQIDGKKIKQYQIKKPPVEIKIEEVK